MAKLYVTLGDGERKVLDLEELVTIGRQSSNSVQVLSAGVSRQHAEIRLVGGRWVLRDLESRNGTLLNGELVREGVLKDGDEIRIGDSLMRFEAAESTRGLEKHAAAATEPGDLNERFQILEKIGSGDATTDYRAVVRDKEQLVALKVLKLDLATSGEVSARFLEAARGALGIHHPNLVEVLDAGQAGPVFFAATEYVTGESAAALLARERRLSPARALRLAADAARGLSALHERGVLHHDLRPANLFAIPDGRAKIANAGMGFLSPGSAQAYAPPEGAVGAAADLYSLGALLHHLVLGIPPGASFDPERLEGILSPGLANLLAECLQHDPEARPDSAAAVAEEMGRQAEVEQVLEKERARWREERAAPEPPPEAAISAIAEAAPRAPAPPALPPAPRRRRILFVPAQASGSLWLIPLALVAGILLTDADLLLDFLRSQENRRSTRIAQINAAITSAIDAENVGNLDLALEGWREAIQGADAFRMDQLSDRIRLRIERIEKIRTRPPPKESPPPKEPPPKAPPPKAPPPPARKGG